MVNPFLLLLIIFVLEIFLLALFSRALFASLGKLFYRLTNSRETTINLLAALFWPGTAVHELSHAIWAGVMMVDIGEINFMPQIEEDSVKLGTAEIAKTDPLRRTIIGFAPLFSGILIIIIALWLLVPNLGAIQNLEIWKIALALYIIFVIANTMFSSKKDLEGSFVVFLILIGLILALYFLNSQAFFFLLEKISSSNLIDVIQKADLFLLVPITIDLLIYLLVKGLSRR